MKAVGYVRLSQDSDTSISSQIEDIQDYCSKHGIELVRIFNEGEYSSGWDTAREEFEKMVKFVERGGIDIIVVRDGSRLGRVFKDRLYWLLYFDRLGVQVHTIKGRIDPDEPTDLLLESVRAFSDDVVKRGEIERSKRELEKRKKRGLPLGRPPFGFKYSPDGLRLVPNENFKKARMIIKLRDNGVSWPQIAKLTGVPMSTCRSVYLKKRRYEKFEKFSPQE